jgi:hypothetical protein
MGLVITKVCTTCKNSKPLGSFRRQSKNKDGLKYTCVDCDDARARKRYYQKKDSIISNVKKWQDKNPELVKAYKVRNRRKNGKGR